MELRLGIAKLVDDAIEKKASEEKQRDYLGASILGEECSRKLWYMFHTPKPLTDPRINRIFRLGNLIEDEIINLLRMSGVQVYTHNDDGEQFGFVDGKVAGHIDGVAVGLPESTKPHLLEFKSANDKAFNEFKNNGYKSNAKYWAQVQVYMLKMGLENALVVVYNKNTSELYFERIKLKKRDAEMYISKGKAIADMTDQKPMRKYSKSTLYLCKWCDHSEECWQGEE